MKDAINPDHYKYGRVECIEIVRNLPFSLGSAIKYLYRLGRKDDEKQERAKAAWYINDFLNNPQPLGDTSESAKLLDLHLTEQAHEEFALLCICNFLDDNTYFEHLIEAYDDLVE